MKTKRIAMVIPAKCKTSKNLFGIRAEQFENTWSLTWSFPIKETTIEKERLSNNSVSGTVIISQDYPGCPHCGNPSMVVCGCCGKTSCFEPYSKEFKCPWCNSTGMVQMTNSFDEIKGGGY